MFFLILGNILLVAIIFVYSIEWAPFMGFAGHLPKRDKEIHWAVKFSIAIILIEIILGISWSF